MAHSPVHHLLSRAIGALITQGFLPLPPSGQQVPWSSRVYMRVQGWCVHWTTYRDPSSRQTSEDAFLAMTITNREATLALRAHLKLFRAFESTIGISVDFPTSPAHCLILLYKSHAYLCCVGRISLDLLA